MKGWPGEPEMEYDKVMSEGKASDAEGQSVTDVLFDFGNVLVKWNPQPVMTPRYSQELVDAFLDNDISGFYDASDAMDAGGTEAEVIADVRARYGEPWVSMLEYYFANFEDSLVGPIPGARVLVNDLKAAGIGVWGLSNWAVELFGPAKKQYPILSSLDDSVVSGYVKLRKPHTDIFEYAVERFGVDRRHCLFVDDKAMNVVGANQAGIRALRFSDAVKLRETLVGMGVPIPAVQH